MGKVGIGGRSRHLSIDARDGAHKAKGRGSGTARSTVALTHWLPVGAREFSGFDGAHRGGNRRPCR